MTTTAITHQEVCNCIPGLTLTGFSPQAQVPSCKSRGVQKHDLLKPALCTTWRGGSSGPKLDSYLSRPMKPCALLPYKDAIGTASLTVHVYHDTAQKNAVINKRGKIHCDHPIMDMQGSCLAALADGCLRNFDKCFPASINNTDKITWNEFITAEMKHISFQNRRTIMNESIQQTEANSGDIKSIYLPKCCGFKGQVTKDIIRS
ncbi:hypothetical protein WISP_14598 [Willisornis vidua]|uniref:Uncharacterized protein n=1 Tax=Willisornis vidua TaxID=1566151 RepID=A0ABQ9DW43_9PASS|nr:hypothetical protein WISP_14598 [Willisornis vidua]